jgi:Fe-S-cluster containining protein
MATRLRAKDAKVWYQEGLQFTCTRCGKCCRDREDPTFVFVEEDDVQRLADCLRTSLKQVIQKYCTWSEDGLVFKRKKGACIFWDDCIGCRIYPARPTQCRTWPFWPANLRQETWKEAARFCPGCNKGKSFGRSEIENTASLMLGRRGEGSLWPGEIPLITSIPGGPRA